MLGRYSSGTAILIQIYESVFETGQRLLTEALNALGFKDEHTRQDEKVPVVINTLPWPRSGLVTVPDQTVSLQSSPGKHYAVVKAGDLAIDPIESSVEQFKSLHRVARSTPS